MTSSSAAEIAPESQQAGPLAITGWVLFDWAAQPYYTLITTFLFAPYFAAAVIGDEAWGIALWGYTMAAAAIMVALISPILGAVADASGGLKRYIGWLSIGFFISQAALWYAVPAASAGTIALIMAALVISTMTAEFATVLNNSLMPRLVTADRLGRLSGTGWAVGYLGGLISLVIMASFILIDMRTGKTVFGLEPLLPLDAATHEMDRFVGPFCAVWYAIFVLPFFLFTPDAPPKPGAARASLGSAFQSLHKTLSHIRNYRNIVIFFLARMLYIDGLLAIFTFGGIYARAVFGWESLVLGYFGIILALAGGVGALLGGFLDDRLGSKTVILGSLILLMIGALGVVSIDRDHVLFFAEVAPRADTDGLLASTGEIFYIAFGIMIGLASGPMQSASRSLLARMAPAERMSEFFGFFAFSGKVTAFLAPLLVGIVANVSGSLRIAMSVILLFLIAGLVLMSLVKSDGLERQHAAA